MGPQRLKITRSKDRFVGISSLVGSISANAVEKVLEGNKGDKITTNTKGSKTIQDKGDKSKVTNMR